MCSTPLQPASMENAGYPSATKIPNKYERFCRFWQNVLQGTIHCAYVAPFCLWTADRRASAKVPPGCAGVSSASAAHLHSRS